jgi:hypothetical protein
MYNVLFINSSLNVTETASHHIPAFEKAVPFCDLCFNSFSVHPLKLLMKDNHMICARAAEKWFTISASVRVSFFITKTCINGRRC